MASVRFWKYEGLGNDFVVVDDLASSHPALAPEEARRWCDRHRGVGADGILTLLAARHHGAVARLHITNADGSIPEMCGNGLRCVSAWLVDNGIVALGDEHVVDTDAGPRRCSVLDAELDGPDGTGGTNVVRVEMGAARFDVPGQIPRWDREHVAVDGLAFRASAVSMGNPHCVLEAEPNVDVARRIGPILERDPRFPQRTNVELCAVRSDGSVDVVVWERGVGITEACGTGACGVAAVLARSGQVPFDKDVRVRLPGGELMVRVPREPDGTVWMTGPARRVFAGEL